MSVSVAAFVASAAGTDFGSVVAGIAVDLFVGTEKENFAALEYCNSIAVTSVAVGIVAEVVAAFVDSYSADSWRNKNFVSSAGSNFVVVAEFGFVSGSVAAALTLFGSFGFALIVELEIVVAAGAVAVASYGSALHFAYYWRLHLLGRYDFLYFEVF